MGCGTEARVRMLLAIDDSDDVSATALQDVRSRPGWKNMQVKVLHSIRGLDDH
jgi:hypothetical protein